MMMPRPIAKSQFSNDIFVSGDGKPLTVHQETHFVERHDRLPSNETAMNEMTAMNETAFEPPLVL